MIAQITIVINITGGKKWVLCINYERRRQQLSAGQTGVATPTTELHLLKVMLSVWREIRGVIY